MRKLSAKTQGSIRSKENSTLSPVERRMEVIKPSQAVNRSLYMEGHCKS